MPTLELEETDQNLQKHQRNVLEEMGPEVVNKRYKADLVTKIHAIKDNNDELAEWVSTHKELFDRGHPHTVRTLHLGARRIFFWSIAKMIFNCTKCPYELPAHSWTITNPTRTPLDPKTNVKNIIQDTFGTPYFSVCLDILRVGPTNFAGK